MKRAKKIILLFISIAILTFLFLFCYDHFWLHNKCSLENDFASYTGQTNDTESNLSTGNNENVEPVKEDVNIKMTVIGDIMCHNSQYKDAYDGSTYDFSYVFDDIKDYISSADIAVGNLETTFAGKERGYSNYPRFNSPEQLAYNLKDMGIDVLCTANNHSMDTNYSGVVSTLDFLDDAGISHMGTSRTAEEQNQILVKDVNGIKIAFLAFTYGTNGIPVPSANSYCVNLIDKDLILKQLELAKAQEPDLICVNMHWGLEYQNVQNSDQEDWADFLFENGVDVILGSHPHVLQPMEKRTVTLEDGTTKDCFVIYSLGNFISGQTKKNTRTSIILNINFTKDGETGKTTIGDVSYVPIYMYKSSSGSTKRYKLLDITNSIAEYENGSDTSIGQSTYSTLKSELTRVNEMMSNS